MLMDHSNRKQVRCWIVVPVVMFGIGRQQRPWLASWSAPACTTSDTEGAPASAVTQHACIHLSHGMACVPASNGSATALDIYLVTSIQRMFFADGSYRGAAVCVWITATVASSLLLIPITTAVHLAANYLMYQLVKPTIGRAKKHSRAGSQASGPGKACPGCWKSEYLYWHRCRCS